VIIQTYQPDHPAIDHAARYDYEGFFEEERAARLQAGYPPFGRLVRLMFGHTNARYAREEAMRLGKALELRRSELGSHSDVVGPAPAYVPRVRGRWRWQLLLRGREPAELVRDFLLPAGWTVDVDPIATA
jgi:primosomal protein N' (replication factor Y)